MKTPKLFFPTERLELPLGLDDHLDLEIIRESKPIMASLGAVAVVKSHFPAYPVWEDYPDSSGGSLYVAMTLDDSQPKKAIVEDNQPIVPFSADGFLFRQDAETIFSHGVLQDDGTMHVWWGVSTFDLSSDFTPYRLNSWLSYFDSEAFRVFDLRRGSKRF